MNLFDLLDSIGNVEEPYIQEALGTKKSLAVSRPAPLGRTVLIAAAIALALLLVGCVAVFLGLQERQVGEYTYTQQFDAQGKAVEPSEKTMAVAAMTGSGESPAHLAAKEWWAFIDSYDPGDLGNDPDLAGIPNNYEYTYSCYTQEMVDKLDSIAQKYDLKLLDTRVVVQREQKAMAMDALGIHSLFREEAGVEASYGAFLLYPPENFTAHLTFSLPEGEGAFTKDIYTELSYLRNDYIAPNNSYLTYDPESSQQWEYTTSDGTTVLLVLTSSPGAYTFEGKIIAEGKDATLVAELDLVEGLFLEEDTLLPTQRDLEQLADCFDYSITPKTMDGNTLAQEVRAAEEAYQESIKQEADALWQPPTYQTYGDWLLANCFFPEGLYYAFYDLDSDGVEDVFIGTADGVCKQWLTSTDGQVQVPLDSGFRLYQEGVLMYKDPEMENYIYYRLTGKKDSESGSLNWEILQSVAQREGDWVIDHDPCTAEEAEAAMAAYQPVELDLRPLVDFPMGDGRTFGQVLEEEETPTEDQIRSAWADYAAQREVEFTCFAIEDINGDGVEDLLLSVDAEMIYVAVTYRRGQVLDLMGDFYLCQDNVLELRNRRETFSEGITESIRYYKLEGDRWVFQEILRHSVSADTWRRGSQGDISKEEAQAVLDAYARVTPDFRPIGELTDG